MPDVLIRDVPDEVLAAIDGHAAELGCPVASTCAADWVRMHAVPPHGCA